MNHRWPTWHTQYGSCDKCRCEDDLYTPMAGMPMYCERCLAKAKKQTDMMGLLLKIGVGLGSLLLLKVALQRMGIL